MKTINRWNYDKQTYEPENKIAKEFYHSFGFVENGDMDGDEVIAILNQVKNMGLKKNIELEN